MPIPHHMYPLPIRTLPLLTYSYLLTPLPLPPPRPHFQLSDYSNYLSSSFPSIIFPIPYTVLRISILPPFNAIPIPYSHIHLLFPLPITIQLPLSSPFHYTYNTSHQSFLQTSTPSHTPLKTLPFITAFLSLSAAFVTTQVDRYNSLLVGAPKYLLDCLQPVLNAAARLLCNRRKYDHVTPLLRDVLHWLPVPLRVEFKICLLVYKSLHGAAPPGYLRDYCKETHSSASGLRLRSTDKCDLLVRRMKTRFGDRAFSAAGPRCWNKLPVALRAANSIDSFKTGLRPTCSAEHIPLLVDCKAPL